MRIDPLTADRKMEEEEEIPIVLRDDCEDGRDGLTAKDVLRGDVEEMCNELEEFVERPPEIDIPVKVEIQEEEDVGEYIEYEEPMDIKMEDDEDESRPHTSRPVQARIRRRPKVKETQMKVGEEILKMIKESQPHIQPENFKYFEMFIITPNFLSLGYCSASREQFNV